MTGSQLSRIARHAAVIAWGLLSVYWVALAVSTHLPPATVDFAAGSLSDKALHAGAYLGLGLLAAFAWRATFGRFHRPAGLVLLVLLAAFGAVDEITQPYFSRCCDLNDWVSDVVGAAIGLVLFRIVLAIVESRRLRDKRLAASAAQ